MLKLNRTVCQRITEIARSAKCRECWRIVSVVIVSAIITHFIYGGSLRTFDGSNADVVLCRLSNPINMAGSFIIMCVFGFCLFRGWHNVESRRVYGIATGGAILLFLLSIVARIAVTLLGR